MNKLLADCVALLARGSKPTVPEVRPLVQAYYALPGNGAGGSLHVVLDDHNVEDDFVRSCVSYAEDRGDLVGACLGNVLLLMSKTQRRKVRSA